MNAVDRSPSRSWKQAMLRGFGGRCPSCGRASLFDTYVKVAARCTACGEELHHQRADDAPAYFTMVVVAHIIVPALLMVEKFWAPDLLIHAAIWLPLTLILTLALLPRIKGAIVGLQWANRMHGFGAEPEG
jgi:uncharacterized protein (DUF983 family)